MHQQSRRVLMRRRRAKICSDRVRSLCGKCVRRVRPVRTHSLGAAPCLLVDMVECEPVKAIHYPYHHCACTSSLNKPKLIHIDPDVCLLHEAYFRTSQCMAALEYVASRSNMSGMPSLSVPSRRSSSGCICCCTGWGPA